MMTTLQKIYDCIDKTDYAQYFVLMRKAVGRINALSILEQEFLSGRYGFDLPQRMRTLANSLLTALPTAHKFLTNFLKPTDFVGRQAELEQLHALLEAGEASVIVNGLGGVGKTTLARQYVWQHKKNYHHIIWLEQQNTLLSTLITNERLTDNMHFTTETEEERFKCVMRGLEETEGKNILVIDNYEQKEIDNDLAVLDFFRNALFSHWCILFTSRERVRHFKPIDLSFLPTPEAIELFTLHCGNKAFNEKTLVLLFEEVGYHTLMIELLAKTYANNFDIERLENLLTVLQQKEYDHALLQELIDTEHHKGYEPLYKHLLLLFNMEHWTNEEQYILKQFAVLPSLPIKAKQLLDWLQDEKRVYKNTLQNLVLKGWLSTKDQQQYEMHRLLKVLIQKKLGTMWEDVNMLVENVKGGLTKEKIMANPVASQWFIEYVNSFLENINFQNNKIENGYLQHKLAYLYGYISYYEQAILFFNNSLNIVKKCIGNKNKTYAELLNDLGEIYYYTQKYEKAIKLFSEALEIRKEVLGEKHPDYMMSLHNLASTYTEQNQYEKAIKLFSEALGIRKEILEKKHPDYAESLHGLAYIYAGQGQYEEAIKLYQEALKIRKKVLGEKHPDYVYSLNNLANIYIEQGQYEEAIKLHQEALKIRKEVLGEKHIDYAISLRNYSIIYYNLQDYKKSLSLLEEAYPIILNTFGDNHKHTKKCKDYLEKSQQALQNQINTEL